MTYLPPDQKQKILTSTKKLAGMLTKIDQMVENDAYCGDIAQQLNASIGLLKGIQVTILKNHLLCCGMKRLGSHDISDRQAFVEELIRIRDMSSRA